jgi:hypothetical protein
MGKGEVNVGKGNMGMGEVNVGRGIWGWGVNVGKGNMGKGEENMGKGNMWMGEGNMERGIWVVFGDTKTAATAKGISNIHLSFSHSDIVAITQASTVPLLHETV